LTVVHTTSSGNPAPLAACRAGACPRLALQYTAHQNFPDLPGAIPAFRNAPSMAIEPSRVADTSFSDPPKLPMGVLTAATITTSLFMISLMI